jgi:U3 small nucleolar RNA-associated protein 14
MDPSNDLLAFVSALNQNNDEKDSTKSKNKKNTKKQQVPVIEPKPAIDISDFAALVEEINPKKRKRLLPSTPAPLPKVTQTRLERKVALESTTKDVSARWDPYVKKMSQKESLKFPLNPDKVPKKTAESLMADFVPQNDFEKQFVNLMKTASASTIVGANALSDKDHMIEFANFPACEDNNENPDATGEAAKKRAQDFYKEQRQKHVSKIKSKTYRKHLAKSKARQSLREKLESGDFGAMTAHEQEKNKQAAELARIKERVTLKTQKASKWAHELLLNKRSDREFRSGIAAQVKEQQLLREHIMEKANNYDQDEDSDYEQTEQEENRSELDKIKKELEIKQNEYREEQQKQVIGRRKFGGSKTKSFSEEINDEESDDQKENSTPSGPIKVVAKSPITPELMKNEVQGDEALEDTNEKDSNTEEYQDPLATARERLERNKKLAELIFSAPRDNEANPQKNSSDSEDSDFEKEKKDLIISDAPKTENVTLPGWGNWSGPGLSVAAPKVQVLKHTPGIDPKQRKDFHLRNVIISEKKLPGMDKYTVPNVPLPFSNRQQYEAHLRVPVGPEWNSQDMHRKLIQPRVTAPAGSVIKAPKLPQLNHK